MPVETSVRRIEGPLASATEARLWALPQGTDPGFDPGIPLADLLAFHEAKNEPGEIVSIPVQVEGTVRELLLYGTGDGAPAALRKAGAAVTRRAKGEAALAVQLPASAEESIDAFLEGALLAAYSFTFKTSGKKPVASLILVSATPAAAAPAASADAPSVEEIPAVAAAWNAAEGELTEGDPAAPTAAAVEALPAVADARSAAEAELAAAGQAVVWSSGGGPGERAGVIVGAVALARDLANEPSVEKCPEWLADRAAEVGAAEGLGVRVWDEQALNAGGFGGILAVGAGSARPPRLIQLTYEPEGATRHIVLVGKGITFDTGGLSLKPSDGMKTMKTDMAGGAVVIGVLSALRALNVNVKVTGLIASAENMPSGSAMRPSDVITHFGGITSEVLNTDAEGRLVLADALAYADAALDPDAVIDIATLTGAAKMALGLRHGALFATDDLLAKDLTEAGTAADEPLWRLPLVDDYRPAIESDVADVANIGRQGFGAGSITAALFLEKFAGSRPWAHLDVAGPARGPEGATGYGVRLLLTWLTAA